MRTREAVRYLGYGRHTVDDGTRRLLSDSFAELDGMESAKSVYRIFDLCMEGEGRLRIGNLDIASRSLEKNLRGCCQAVLFAATLGAEVDRRMKRYLVTDMPRAVVMQACAAAKLEEYCDACQEELAMLLGKEQKFLRPRFSPGYGDFPLACQEPLVRMLDCAKTIGVTLTSECMMTPVKSVTAVMGISETDEQCHRKGCEACEKTDCLYRRSSEICCQSV